MYSSHLRIWMNGFSWPMTAKTSLWRAWCLRSRERLIWEKAVMFRCSNSRKSWVISTIDTDAIKITGPQSVIQAYSSFQYKTLPASRTSVVDSIFVNINFPDILAEREDHCQHPKDHEKTMHPMSIADEFWDPHLMIVSFGLGCCHCSHSPVRFNDHFHWNHIPNAIGEDEDSPEEEKISRAKSKAAPGTCVNHVPTSPFMIHEEDCSKDLNNRDDDNKKLPRNLD